MSVIPSHDRFLDSGHTINIIGDATTTPHFRANCKVLFNDRFAYQHCAVKIVEAATNDNGIVIIYQSGNAQA